MYTILTNRRDDKDRDEGFTLIELMVVVLIIAILLAIAIPTFLGAQSKAKDRGAQSAAKNSLTAAKTIYADTGDYSGATFDALTAIEPNITFVKDAASTNAKQVSIVEPVVTATSVHEVWYAAVLSDSGTCYVVRDSIDPEDATFKGTGYGAFEPTATLSCVAGAVPPAGYATSW